MVALVVFFIGLNARCNLTVYFFGDLNSVAIVAVQYLESVVQYLLNAGWYSLWMHILFW